MTSPLTLLRTSRPFFSLWAGQLISQMGNSFHYMALSWLLLSLTGSPGLMGGILVAQLLPSLFPGIFLGPLVDRVPRKIGLMIPLDLVRALLVLSIPILWTSGFRALWYLYGIVFLVSTLTLAFAAAEKSLIPGLVAPEALTTANGLNESASQIASLAGPVLAGLLLGVLPSPVTLLYLDAASFVASAFFLLGLPRRKDSSSDRPGTHGPPERIMPTWREWWGATTAGVRFLAGDRFLARVTLMAIFVNFAAMPIMVLFPLLSARVFQSGPEGYGGLLGSFGLGMLSGSLLAGAAERRFSPRRIIIGGMACLGGSFLGLAWAPSLWVALGFSALGGFVVAPGNALIFTLVQEATPPALHGRVFALLFSLTSLAAPLGVAVASRLAEHLSPAHLLAGMGIVVELVALWGMLYLHAPRRATTHI